MFFNKKWIVRGTILSGGKKVYVEYIVKARDEAHASEKAMRKFKKENSTDSGKWLNCTAFEA